MSDQQSERTSENEDNSNLNDARFMSASSVQSTPPSRKERQKQSNAKDKMKRIQIMIANQNEYQQLRQALTISVKKKKKSHHKTPLQKQNTDKTAKSQIKTAQVKNKKGCKLSNLCAVCLCQFNIVRGSLDCLHQFCFQCIKKWCQSSTICPCCRKQIKSILKLVRETVQGPVKQTQRIPVQKKMLTFQSQYDHYICYQCGTGEDEHVLLICDECDFYCCHVYCDQELNSVMPQDDWFCIYCRNRRRRRRNANLSEIIRTVLQSQAETQTQTQQSQLDEDSKGVFMRTRSRNSLETTSVQRNIVNRLRDMRRRVR